MARKKKKGNNMSEENKNQNVVVTEDKELQRDDFVGGTLGEEVKVSIPDMEVLKTTDDNPFDELIKVKSEDTEVVTGTSQASVNFLQTNEAPGDGTKEPEEDLSAETLSDDKDTTAGSSEAEYNPLDKAGVNPTLHNIVDLFGDYISVMGDDNPTKEEQIAAQKILHRGLMFNFAQPDAPQRISHIVEIFKVHKDGAFSPMRLYRMIGTKEVNRTVEEATEFRELLTALSCLASDRPNADYLSFDHLRDLLRPHNADNYIAILKTVAGENNV